MACCACGMALRKGEAPGAPRAHWGRGNPQSLWEPMGGMALQGYWGCSCAWPQRVSFSSSCPSTQDGSTRETGWASNTPSGVPRPEPSAGLGPAALPATWRPSRSYLGPSRGLAPPSWLWGTLWHCLCPIPRPPEFSKGRDGPVRGAAWCPAVVLGALLLRGLAPFVPRHSLTLVS